MTYNYNEVFEASKEYFKGDELAARVWATKYAIKDAPPEPRDGPTGMSLFLA